MAANSGIINTLRKPAWLSKKIDFRKCRHLNRLLKDLNLNTVCQQALCPNISECFAAGAATFLILGKICTRGCKFCAVRKGIPEDVDLDEPRRVTEAVKRLGLRHVVITSVTRDDLPDGGASVFADNIVEIHKLQKDIAVEVLVPDFYGEIESIKKVITAKPDIFAHNIETIPRLYGKVRKAADYMRSLDVLKTAKKLDNNIYIKSGIMLGLGETEQEVLDVFDDLRDIKCDFLSIGQYLAPSLNHFTVKEYITPEKFEFYKRQAQKLGFLHIESAPYVRSSYLASGYIGKGEKRDA